MLHEQKMDEVVCRELGIEGTTSNLSEWEKMVNSIHSRKDEIQIALVGKYVKLHDSYLSIVESLNHASFVVGRKLKIKWVDSDSVTDETAPEIFKDCAGIILPGGFGNRGIEGMITSARFARTHKMPYFGICLGRQIAVIEFARDVADKIIFMADGVIAEEGTPEQVIGNPQNPRTQAFLSRFNQYAK